MHEHHSLQLDLVRSGRSVVGREGSEPPQSAALPRTWRRAVLALGRGNYGVRKAAAHEAQRTYGNRAVQRFVRANAPGALPVQRQSDGEESWLSGMFEEMGHALQGKAPESVASHNDDVATARQGRTAASGTLRAGREATRAMATAAPEAHRSSMLRDMIKSLTSPNIDDFSSAMDKYEEATELAQKAGKSGLAGGLEKHTGRTSPVGRGLRGLNYGLQFLENWGSGQDMGEAAAGAAGGGFMSNFMPGYLFSKSPKLGWTDTIVNVGNAALQLGGAPAEIGGLTQAAADATPTGFATSVVSNAMRGLWNTGEGVFTGDWSDLKKQGEDITHGRAGAPLQGFGMGVDMIASALRGKNMSKSSNYLTSNEAERGDLGMLPAVGNMIADEWYDMGDRPGGFGAAFADAGEYLWEGTHGKGGVKGGVMSAADWVGDKLFGDLDAPMARLEERVERLQAAQEKAAQERWRESALRSGWDGKRMPVRTGGSGDRVPIRTGGDAVRTPVDAGGGETTPMRRAYEPEPDL